MADFHPAHGTVRFGAYELDSRASELRKQGAKVKLQEQPFQILQVLVQRAGEIVTREELQQKIWPSDTFVDFDHGLYNAIKRLREALGDSAETPSFVETVARRGYRFVGKIECEAARMRSLAVLPLENLSRDPEQEYFAEGMTEALITTLAKIGELRVVSRTSIMLYKGVRKPLREIARELGVEAIVEGTVLRAGDRVRITAQLIDAAKEAHLWAESYERDLRDVLALQAEVAQAVAREVRVKLTPQEQVHLSQVHPVDPEAYEAYLKGRYLWNRRSGAAVGKAIQCFQQAIAKDPTYAAAYAGLADCAGGAGFGGFTSPEDGCGKAKVAARKALEMAETAEAHASLGWAILHYDWDFVAAEKEFLRAIQLNSSYATAHQWYGHCLACVGRFGEALAETGRAVQLDPLSLIIHASHAGASWMARDWEYALAHSRQALELDPSFTWLHWLVANAYQGQGLYTQAVDERRLAVELSGNAPLFLAELGGTYAAAGKRNEALQILEQLKELSKTRYVMAYWFALIHCGLQEREPALYWLEKALQERSAMLAWVKVDPCVDYLRSDPRFDDLLRRMNFPA